MGGSKDYMQWRNDLDAIAVQFLCDIGHLERCEFHGSVYGLVIGLDKDVYAEANRRINAGQIEIGDAGRADFSEAIKRVHDRYQALDECNACVVAAER